MDRRIRNGAQLRNSHVLTSRVFCPPTNRHLGHQTNPPSPHKAVSSANAEFVVRWLPSWRLIAQYSARFTLMIPDHPKRASPSFWAFTQSPRSMLSWARVAGV
jgi:hypothetical protein